MKKSLFDIRIPNFAAFLLLVVSIGVTVFLIRGRTDFQGHASQDVIPQHVMISNITQNSFTVSFTTQANSQGAVVLEETNTLNSLFTDSQETTSSKEFVNHSITVNKLQPETQYSFSIISNDKKYLDESHFFTVKTGNVLDDTSSNTKVAQGRILLPNGQPANGALVYVNSDSSQLLSSITKPDGTFTIPLAQLRTPVLTAYQALSPNDVITITARSQQDVSSIQTFYENVGKIPDITLTENYTFTNTITPLSLATQSALPSVSFTVASTNPTLVKITSPLNKARIIDLQPQIKGTAGPNQSVKITLSPDNISAAAPVANSGNWSYRPSKILSAGNHTITVSAKDGNGTNRTITQTFIVLPPGSQVAQAATPSATITQAPTKTPTPTTPRPTNSASLTPTNSPTPTSIATTLTPTATPTATFTPSPTFTPTPTIPQKITPTLPSPGGESSLVLTGVSLFFIVTGAVLFFFIS
jgi:hypothetical protein